MNLDTITPVIMTWNEQSNLERVLAAISWAARIVVVDSESDDDTKEIAERHQNVEFIVRKFDNHTAQWTFGVEQVRTPWVLSLDADYVCPAALADELRQMTPKYDAYNANFRYCIGGKPLRGTLYPPRVVLFRAGRFRYRQDGHTQLLDVSEPVGTLATPLLHDDRKPLNRWLANQSCYSELEADKLLTTSRTALGWKDWLRKQIVWAPLLTFIYCLFFKGLFLDGWRGIFYALQRTYAELLLSLKLLERKLK